MQNVFGILLAAGSGSRLGADTPKAFVEVENDTILSRSFYTLQNAKCLKNIIVTVPPQERLNAECQRLEEKGAIVIPGGTTRRESVFLALRYLQNNHNPEKLAASFVLIHDAARCFVTPSLVQKVASAVPQHLAVTTGVPSIDSLKRVDAERNVVESIPRKDIWCVQTPQAFRFDILWRAHEAHIGDATDDASMVEPFQVVTMIEGERTNRKITVPEDLAERS